MAPETLFYDEPQAAVDWSLSVNGLAGARQRGELEGAYKLVGRRVLYSRIAPRLAALGLSDPAALGAFCRGAGISDLAGLMRWIGGPAE
jgi:hypothetical protein